MIWIAYPVLGEYLGLNNALPGRVLWQFWRFLSRQCEPTLTETGNIPVVAPNDRGVVVDAALPQDILLEVEHIIDVSTSPTYIRVGIDSRSETNYVSVVPGRSLKDAALRRRPRPRGNTPRLSSDPRHLGDAECCFRCAPCCQPGGPATRYPQ
jgi:hypothetical protein